MLAQQVVLSTEPSLHLLLHVPFYVRHRQGLVVWRVWDLYPVDAEGTHTRAQLWGVCARGSNGQVLRVPILFNVSFPSKH